MDSKKRLFDLLASFLIVLRRFFYLAVTPYKTQRKISLEKDFVQVFFIFLLVFLYFAATRRILLFTLFLLNFSITVAFFYGMGRVFKKNITLKSFIFTFSYALLPTLIWFGADLFLYLVLPPPRTLSLLGRAFSIFFVSFSLSLLFWKIILVYLALRFSMRQNFYHIVFTFLLYLTYLIPVSYLLYVFGFSKVPFI
ncbi:hypothetical protein HYT33_03095 [Candidatus Roizmanbacteria bacterium]|nr:hypothetical protein [Candidatus Roizmanbacteria bacterium]